jgi:hypothetical protein
MDIKIELDVIGQAIPAGYRLRLALSTTHWPWLCFIISRHLERDHLCA